MDTMKDTTMQPATDAVIDKLRKVIADCYWPTSPVAINEILDRLEAAEKERDDVAQQLVQSEVGKREISEAHDALQVEVGKLKDLEVSRCVKINGYIVDNARLAEEVVRLQAKIAEMEQQEPARLVTAVAYRWRYRGDVMWQYGELKEETARWAKEYNHEVQPLYALPGTKGE